MTPSSGLVVGRASTAFSQLLLSMPEKYAAHSYEWIFPQVNQFTARQRYRMKRIRNKQLKLLPEEVGSCS
jgi:hypothetical protein